MSKFERDLKDAMADVVERELVRRASAVRCPTHGTAPTNLRASIVLDGEGGLEFDACCDALRDAVHEALQGTEEGDGADDAVGGEDD